jgi:uncharacterized cupredoxin-like copper-binding protein
MTTHTLRSLWTSRVVVAVVALVATVAMTACASSQGKTWTTQVTSTARGSTVEVILKDYEIVMPESVPAGEITFNITNAGGHPHNLEVELPGNKRRLDNDLKPGESRTLVVTMIPGTYSIECPVGLHSPQGMRRKLLVTGQQ